MIDDIFTQPETATPQQITKEINTTYFAIKALDKKFPLQTGRLLRSYQLWLNSIKNNRPSNRLLLRQLEEYQRTFRGLRNFLRP